MVEEVIINLIIGKGAFNIPVQFALKNRRQATASKRKSSLQLTNTATKIGTIYFIR